MKVLHLISGGDTGGAKTHLLSLMSGLDRVIDAKIICFIEDTFYYDLKNEGIDIEVYEQSSRFDMSIVNKLKEEIEKNKYDIIHCHGARANFIAMFLKKKIKQPMITTVHSDYKLDFKDNLIKKLLFTPLNTFALKRFNNFIAISDSFKEMLVDRGFRSESIYIAYNGIDLESKEEYMSKEEYFKKVGVKNKDKKFVGILARLDEVKDHDTFLKAANEILKIRDDVEFLIAGDGYRKVELENKVKDLKLQDKIHFLGFIKDQYSFLNSIDINTLTSLSESFPYVVLEGAKMKKPLVSTNVGGLKKIVEDGKSGYLVEVGDYKNFANKLNLLLENDELSVAMGEELYRRVDKDYSSEAMAKRHIEIYKEVIDKRY